MYEFNLIFEADDYKERSVQFKKHHLRQLKTKSVVQEHKLLGLHSLSYYSPLNACFSFELDDLDTLTYFSPILLRDGVLGLAQFFHKNPKPLKKTVILIHKKLSYLIPKNWQFNCFVYDYQSRKAAPDEQSQKLIISSSGFGKKQGTKQSIELLSEDLKKVNSINEIWLTAFPTFPKVSLQIDIELQNEQIESIVSITKYFNHKIQIKTFYQLEKLNLTNSVFFDLNYYQFYYSDSYGINTLLANGCKPLSITSNASENNFEKVSEINLSFNHKICIYKNADKSKFEAANFLNELKKTSLFKNKVKKNNLIVSKPIEDIAYKMAQEFYKP